MLGRRGVGPSVTCPDCGMTYIEDADWSGPAHNDGDCIKHLRSQIAILTKERDEARSEGGMKQVFEMGRELGLLQGGVGLAVALWLGEWGRRYEVKEERMWYERVLEQ
jgi:hypothetical protein